MQFFKHNGRWVTHEQFLKLRNPKANQELTNQKAPDTSNGKYGSTKFSDLKKLAKDRGIKLTNKEKLNDLISLLEQYDKLKDGDKFQDQIAKFATPEFITENNLEDSLKVGDLYFIPDSDNN